MPLFRSEKNIQYLKRKNREIVEKIVGEKVTYYAISKKFTRQNIYGEAQEKVYEHPVEIYAIVKWGPQEVSSNHFGQDVRYKITFFPLLDTINDLNLSPREGDFVEYDQKKFEITKITYPKQILGKEDNSFYLELDCVSAREGVITISLTGSPDVHARTRPDNDLTASFRYSDVQFPFSSSYDE